MLVGVPHTRVFWEPHTRALVSKMCQSNPWVQRGLVRGWDALEKRKGLWDGVLVAEGDSEESK